MLHLMLQAHMVLVLHFSLFIGAGAGSGLASPMPNPTHWSSPMSAKFVQAPCYAKSVNKIDLKE